MIGSIDPNQHSVTVVGGGIAGLLAAYTFDKLGYEVSLYEKSSRLGGLIQTTTTEYGIVESAAHSLLASPAVIELCRELGVETVPVKRGSNARYIYRRGKMRRMPLTVFELLRTLFRAYFVPARKKDTLETLTLEKWAGRFIGRPALTYLLNPFLRGIYAASPNEICVGAAFPRLLVPHGHSFIGSIMKRKRLEGRKHGRKASMVAPREGMEDLVRKLESYLRRRLGNRIHLNQELEFLPDSGNIVLCTPADVTANFLRTSEPPLSNALDALRYAPLVTATVFVHDHALRMIPRGVGVLFPEREQRDILGILFNSSSFEGRSAHSGISSVTVMLGGTGRPELVRQSDEALTALIESELKIHFGLQDQPLDIRLQRWPRAIPIYDQSLMETWQLARSSWCKRPGHLLFGNYTGQVSLRGMMESIAQVSAGPNQA